MRATIFLVLATGLAACGQTGALYLPDDSVTTPVEIRGPGQQAAPPASAPASAEEAEKAKKSEAPAPPPES
jgi:predicted small lipoprotein YifL